MTPTPKLRSANVRDDVKDDTSAKPMTEPKTLVRQKGFRDSIVIRWLDKHVDKMDKYWSYLPNFAGSVAATLAIFLLGACFRGEWMLIFVHFAKRYNYMGTGEATVVHNETKDANESNSSFRWPWQYLMSDAVPPYVRHFTIAWLITTTLAYIIYFSVGGFLHWYYYIRHRDKAEEWKCQPYKWLSPALEKHEITLGICSLLCTNMMTSLFVTYLLNGGFAMIYYEFDEYTWFWWFLQWPVIYLILDYETYWFHRLYHRPTMYKWFHKLHHTYKQPTAWSATAIHPFEIVHMQMCYLVPLFIIPIHLVPYFIIMVYNFYHGIIDHSGINFKAQWWQPWQPDASFHDNHHQYTHVNFGFNMFFWDKLHNTYRLKDRIYNENIFFGRGKTLAEATKEELETDLQERDSENVDNKIVYKLDEEIIKHAKLN